MCCSKSKWKREQVQDHKFDFVYIDEFYEKKFIRKLVYLFVYLLVFKSVLVYIADVWTAGILLIFDRWSSAVQPKIPFYISKWIYVGCISVSFILLALDMRKARNIIKSKDISYAFTSVIAYRYYVLRSYKHFCFFSQINNSKKIADEVAFFVFFAFKGWKRLIFAEAPRQAINAFTLYSLIQSNKSGNYFDVNEYGSSIVQRLVMALMAFSLLIFVASASMLIVAFLLYIPLLCHIRGNLKEYCCYKIDKRIRELIKKKSIKRQKQRQLEEKAEAMGDFRHLKKKKSSNSIATLKKPTLPKLDDCQAKKPTMNPHLPAIIDNNYSNRVMTTSPEPIIPNNLNNPNYGPTPQQLRYNQTYNVPPPTRNNVKYDNYSYYSADDDYYDYNVHNYIYDGNYNYNDSYLYDRNHNPNYNPNNNNSNHNPNSNRNYNSNNNNNYNQNNNNNYNPNNNVPSRNNQNYYRRI